MKCRSLLQRLAAIPTRPLGSPAPQIVSMIAESMRGATVESSRVGTSSSSCVGASSLIEFEARLGRLVRKRGAQGRNRWSASEAVCIPILTPALLKVSGADSLLEDRAVSFKSGVDRFAVPFVEKLMRLLEVEGRDAQVGVGSPTALITEKLSILPVSDNFQGDRRWAGFPTYIFHSLDNPVISHRTTADPPAEVRPQFLDIDIDPLADIGGEAVVATATTLKDELAKAELRLSQASEATPSESSATPAASSSLPTSKGFLGSLSGTLTKERLGRLGHLLHLPDKGGCDVRLNFAVERLTFPPESPLREMLKRNLKHCHIRHIQRHSVQVPGTPFRCDWSAVRSGNVPIATVELLLAVDPDVASSAPVSHQDLVHVRRLDTILPQEHFEFEVELDVETTGESVASRSMLGPTADWDQQLRAAEQLLELILWIQDELPSGSFVS
jgi:hypothetical protein